MSKSKIKKPKKPTYGELFKRIENLEQEQNMRHIPDQKIMLNDCTQSLINISRCFEQQLIMSEKIFKVGTAIIKHSEIDLSKELRDEIFDILIK